MDQTNHATITTLFYLTGFCTLKEAKDNNGTCLDLCCGKSWAHHLASNAIHLLDAEWVKITCPECIEVFRLNGL